MHTEKLPPVHPGEVLLEDFLKPMGISQYRLAKDIGVLPPPRERDCPGETRRHSGYRVAPRAVLRDFR